MNEIFAACAPDGQFLMEPDFWERVSDLFDQLAASAHPESILADEADDEVRSAAEKLWKHHRDAKAEQFLDGGISFEVLPVFRPGDRLLDNRFRIERMLGAGGMGEVYLAYDQRLEDRVAIKTIARLLAPSASIRRRILGEVQNARRVTHPNVCRIHELFDEGEVVFFSMEYVEGDLLSELLASPAPYPQARTLVRQMAEALHSAHRTGVIHGDFKPSNVMVVPGENPRAVIMDFGLARAVNRSTPVAGGTLSLQGGTEDYMAPELLSGAVPTIRSDIFAFGKVARALMPRERLWDQCTRSHAEERLGSLDPVIRKLDEQRSRRYWIGGSVVLAAGALAYELLPPATRSLLLPKGTRLLINGFRAVAGEPATPGLLRSLVLTGVAQSPRITPVTDQDLLPVLRRIEPSAALPVSGGVLRDLLVSLRATFWIDGDTERRGSRLALTLRLLRTADNALVAEKEFGDVAGVGVLAALVAAWIRTASGESADSLKLNSAAAIQFTSQVPEALEKYFDAMAFFAVANMDQALPNFREAIRLDPNFAQAHSMLGACLNSYGRFEESFAEVGRAFQISATLPERERTWIEVNYFTLADDPVRMVEAARQNVAYHPDEPRFLRTLGRNLARTGNPSEGVSYIRHAVELAPDDALLRTDLMEVLCEAGQFDEASAIFEQRTDLAQRVPYAYRGKMYALLGLERYRDAAGVLESDPARDPDLAVTIKILRGDLEGTIADLESALGGMELSGSTLERFQANAFLCGLYFVTDRPAKAVPHLRAMLNFPNVPCRSKYFEQVAFWAGRLGDDATLGKASSILAESADRWPHPRTRMASDYASALVNLRNRNQSEAEALLLKASGVPWSLWSLFDLASLYTTNKKHDLAESHWDKFNSRRGMVLCYHFPGLLPLSWLFRGQSAQARGDRSSARLYGQKVLDLWSRQNGATHIVELARNLVEKT